MLRQFFTNLRVENCENSRILKLKSLYISALFVIFFCFSCSQGEICKDSQESSAYTGFYKNINGVLYDTTFGKIAVKGLQSPDTITFDTLINIKAVQLPLPQGLDSCNFVFSFAVYDSVYTQINEGTYKMVWELTHYIDDTLRLIFTRQMYLISTECGFSHLYNMKNLRYTNNMIKSAEIINSEIGDKNEDNIRIYF